MADRIDAYLVAGGRYHDIDFARIELLKLLSEHPHVRTRVGSDYRDVEAIQASRFLVTYTCDVRPSSAEQEALHDFVASGGRWLALHGTNSVLDFTKRGVEAPRIIERLAFTLGSQFIAHPPIQPYKVEPVAPEHPLVEGIGSFEADVREANLEASAPPSTLRTPVFGASRIRTATNRSSAFPPIKSFRVAFLPPWSW